MQTTFGINLLTADDHPIFRLGLQHALKNSREISNITQASDGAEAINILEKKYHHIVLMDINMSPLNGIEATGIISKRFPSSKVIALTMSNDEASVMNMINNGASGYLMKTADREEILTAIRIVATGRMYFSHEITRKIQAKFTISGEIIKSEKSELECDRVRDVLFLMSHEMSNHEIGNLLCLSHRTIEYHRKKICQLSGSRNYIGVIKYAIRKGILDDESLKSKWKSVLEKN